MKISDHRLVGDDGAPFSFVPSPNVGGLFGAGDLESVIVHYTAGRDAASSVRALCDEGRKASAHLVVGRDGSVTQLVSFDTIAWHAGKSAYGDRVGLNRYSIGIEIDNAGLLERNGDDYTSWFRRSYPASEVFEGIHRNETSPTFWHRYTEDQIALVEEICEVLVDAYGITQILGHEEISPRRKVDPEPAFPLDKMRENIFRGDRHEDLAEEETDQPGAGVVTANRLNIRSAPSKHGAVSENPLPKGTVVHIKGGTGDWYDVVVETRGWVSKNFIKTV